jgi:hypothetical protein
VTEQQLLNAFYEDISTPTVNVAWSVYNYDDIPCVTVLYIMYGKVYGLLFGRGMEDPGVRAFGSGSEYIDEDRMDDFLFQKFPDSLRYTDDTETIVKGKYSDTIFKQFPHFDALPYVH